MTDPATPAVTPARKSAAGEDAMILNTRQLLLAEKCTALSGLRTTGIAIFAFPLSVLSVLIATSKLYETAKVMQWARNTAMRRSSVTLLPCPRMADFTAEHLRGE